ncbi:MAG: hypothetical protein IJP09_00905 [Clostridia bacterium]|nr:hypothetical protein [Clostridia bacterium]
MKDKWIKLDNAAKIFPASVSGPDTKVFRFAAELYEPVAPEILQEAVSESAEVFDVYNYVLKRGLFWYYFEKSDLRPVVKEEYKPLCAPIYSTDRKKLLYEVTYYKNRINLEIFHALSDGTGAMKFLECIITKYLSKAHKIKEPELDYDASNHEKEDDSFYRYYDENKNIRKNKVKHRKAYKAVGGMRFSDDRISVITGIADLKATLNEAHKNNTTLTGYLSAVLFSAIGETMPRRVKKQPVVLTIPINLRKHFPSGSARNFFSTVNIEYNFKKFPNDLQSIINTVTSDLKKALSKESLEELIARYSSVENNIFARIAPLSMKDVALRIAHDYRMLETSATLSNIGVASIPEELSEFVKSFDISCATKKLQVCAASFKNSLSLSFTSPYDDFDIQKNFFRKLTENGIHVEIYSNAETLK